MIASYVVIGLGSVVFLAALLLTLLGLYHIFR